VKRARLQARKILLRNLMEGGLLKIDSFIGKSFGADPPLPFQATNPVEGDHLKRTAGEKSGF
jgi:hypothetical protein